MLVGLTFYHEEHYARISLSPVRNFCISVNKEDIGRCHTNRPLRVQEWTIWG